VLGPVLGEHVVHVIFFQLALVPGAKQRVEPPEGETIERSTGHPIHDMFSYMGGVRAAFKNHEIHLQHLLAAFHKTRYFKGVKMWNN